MAEATGRSDWHAMPAEEVARALGASRDGLTSEQAARRREEHGPNRLEAQRGPGLGALLLKQVRNPLIYLLLGAAAISLLAQHPFDAAVIFTVVVLNTIIGVLQEWRAEKALEALRKLSSPQARIVRDGEAVVIDAEDIVPGDVLLLATGDKVTADARVLEAADLQLDESALTGESEPVVKDPAEVPAATGLGDRRDMVWSSTPVTHGRGKALVVETGMGTVLGRIAGEVQSAQREQTPLQQRLSRLGTLIGLLTVAVAVLIFVLGLLRGYDLLEMLLFAVAAAVSAIPEGLPAVISVVLALGVQRMAAQRAIVRRLPAVETLGSTTVICSDKTGTITRNEMTVRRMWAGGRSYDVSGEGFAPEGEVTLEDGTPLDERTADEALARLLEIGVLTNNATIGRTSDGWKVEGTPTEGALVVVARKAGVHPEELERRETRLDEIQFSSRVKYMATLDRPAEGPPLLFVKGAPERLLAFSSHALIDGRVEELTPQLREEIERVNNELADQALRVVAGAFREMPEGTDEANRADAESGLTFVGMWGLLDPPRQAAVHAIAAAQQAGIRVVMITGDHAVTAAAVGRQVGLTTHGERTVTGDELDVMSDDELREIAREVGVYARVSPAHKLRIVSALQSRGEVVAMTGDGVNDGPALKSANIGIAMGITGTEVAKEAAEMVLADDDFATIVRAVEEGRVIFGNLRRVVTYLVTTNIAEVSLLTASLVLGFHLPLTAVMILWINLVTDGMCTIPLGLEPKHDDVLSRPPRPANEGVLTRPAMLRVLLLAAVIATGTLSLFAWELRTVDIEHARTIAFTTLVAFEWFRALSARSSTTSVFRLPFFGNRWLLGGIAMGAMLQVAVVYWPPAQRAFSTAALRPVDWAILLPVAASVLVFDEIVKAVMNLREEGAGAA